MSSITKIDYFLPITRVHLTASVSTVTDTILRRSEPGITTSYAFSLVTVADPDRPRTLKVESGLLQDYSFDLKMTEDGRLTSTDVESTGRATLVLATGAAAVAAGAALVAGQLPLAAALAAGAVKTGEQALSLDEEDDQTAAPPGVDTEVWAAYKQAHPGPAQRTTRLLALCAATESDLDDARDQLREAAGNAERRHELRKQVATLRELLGDLKADLGDLRNLHSLASRHNAGVPDNLRRIAAARPAALVGRRCPGVSRRRPAGQGVLGEHRQDHGGRRHAACRTPHPAGACRLPRCAYCARGKPSWHTWGKRAANPH